MFHNNKLYPRLKFNSSHEQPTKNPHFYLSVENEHESPAVLCYDDVLCYLANVLGHGSNEEIEMNLKRYFTDEQFQRAYENLKQALRYSLSAVKSDSDHQQMVLIEECLNNLVDHSSILSTMEMVERNQLLSYIPTFVTNDWLQMIRNIQDLEKIDTPTPMVTNNANSLQEQMCYLKDQIFSLHSLIENVRHLPLTSLLESSVHFNDQCCLRNYCCHTSNTRVNSTIDSSSSSSWSSLDMEKTPMVTINRSVPGFIRNPVSNFLMPTAPRARNEMSSSMISIDDHGSSDDDQSINSKTGSVVVIRDDDLWIYPMGIETRKSKNYDGREYHRSRSMFTSMNEQIDRNHLFTRRKSFDDEELSRKIPEKSMSHFRKHKKGKGALNEQ